MGLSPAAPVGGFARGRRRWLVHRSVHDLVFLVRPVGGGFPWGWGTGPGGGWGCAASCWVLRKQAMGGLRPAWCGVFFRAVHAGHQTGILRVLPWLLGLLGFEVVAGGVGLSCWLRVA